jgi:hypothetical protein
LSLLLLRIFPIFGSIRLTQYPFTLREYPACRLCDEGKMQSGSFHFSSSRPAQRARALWAQRRQADSPTTFALAVKKKETLSPKPMVTDIENQSQPTSNTRSMVSLDLKKMSL